ncbi:predicted protein [Nematostella vectensis]|uniref:Carbohydrate deacetylase n=1 Tax=Nematostella vectensis TaxID=45351 RepID=A7RM88_NEMVE|nr:predicted protein [Nematostella vectensis]|eukprot:XP_001639525.1 predicted protein [Nematostella vectensis]
MAADPKEKYLIVNADDFGYCSKRNRGILQAFQKGVVTSISLMVNAESSVQAAELAKEHGLPVGLHLNLSEGRPLVLGHKTLVDSDGFMKAKEQLQKLLSQGIIDKKEIQQEIKAQLQWFQDHVGRNPTHVDGHQHVHVFPAVCEILAATMQQMGLKKTRNPVELSLQSCPWIPQARLEFFNGVVHNAAAALDVYSKAGISFPQRFVGLTTMGKNMTEERLQQALSTAFKCQTTFPDNRWSNTCELMVHPGYASTAGCGGCGGGPDEFAQSLDREHELHILTSESFRSFLDSQNFLLQSYHDL